MVTDGGWKPERSLDRTSRSAKAAKIHTLVERRRPLAGARVLEVGTGAGIITSLLAEQVGPDGEMWSVDVDDLRTETDGYHFSLVEGTALPFDDTGFDVVVSNHTIEHVGDAGAQLDHLREIARLLRPDGVGYLATPSRWALVEPHFKVPLLSWLPAGTRTRALRLSGRGQVYDIDPRTRRQLFALIDAAGLDAEDVTADALRVTTEIESSSTVARAVAGLPEAVLTSAGRVLPTIVVLLARR